MWPRTIVNKINDSERREFKSRFPPLSRWPRWPVNYFYRKTKEPMGELFNYFVKTIRVELQSARNVAAIQVKREEIRVLLFKATVFSEVKKNRHLS